MALLGLAWLLLGIAVGFVAQHKNKNLLLWIIYGIIFAPFAIIHVIQLPSPKTRNTPKKQTLAQSEPYLGTLKPNVGSPPAEPSVKNVSGHYPSEIYEDDLFENYTTYRYTIFASLQDRIFATIYPYSDAESVNLRLPDIDIARHIKPVAHDTDLIKSTLFYNLRDCGTLQIGEQEIDDWIISDDTDLSPKEIYALTQSFLLSLTNAFIAARFVISSLDAIEEQINEIFNKTNDKEVPDEDVPVITDFWEHTAQVFLDNSKKFGNFTEISEIEEIDLKKWIHEAVQKFSLAVGLGIPESPTAEQIAKGMTDNVDGGDTPLTNSAKGIEFENKCKNLLERRGYYARASNNSRDQGGDLVVEKDGIRYVIQCKDTDKVGNKAVQEVLAALQFYEADHAAVVTDGSYTSSAKTLAAKNEIALLKSHNLADLEVFFK